MPELTREEKLKLVEKLPQGLQDFMYSEDTGAVLLYLGKKYNLTDEKVHLLSKLVGNVVLGIVPITSLAQEINSKITSDAQVAMNLAQELNTELLAPAMVPAPSTPTTSAPTPTTPQPVAPTPRPVDEYRESASSVPEVVDLRKAPPISAPAPTPQPKAGPPLAEKPIMSTPTPSIPPKPAAPPLTFTRPIEPLIAAPEGGEPRPSGREAEPHKIPPSTPPTPAPRPQYIMRPSGAPPTDLPDNILDLRKDKGEF